MTIKSAVKFIYGFLELCIVTEILCIMTIVRRSERRGSGYGRLYEIVVHGVFYRWTIESQRGDLIADVDK